MKQLFCSWITLISSSAFACPANLLQLQAIAPAAKIFLGNNVSSLNPPHRRWALSADEEFLLVNVNRDSGPNSESGSLEAFDRKGSQLWTNSSWNVGWLADLRISADSKQFTFLNAVYAKPTHPVWRGDIRTGELTREEDSDRSLWQPTAQPPAEKRQYHLPKEARTPDSELGGITKDGNYALVNNFGDVQVWRNKSDPYFRDMLLGSFEFRDLDSWHCDLDPTNKYFMAFISKGEKRAILFWSLENGQIVMAYDLTGVYSPKKRSSYKFTPLGRLIYFSGPNIGFWNLQQDLERESKSHWGNPVIGSLGLRSSTAVHAVPEGLSSRHENAREQFRTVLFETTD